MGDSGDRHSLPHEDAVRRKLILKNSGVEGWHNTCGKDSWGFTRGLPSLKGASNSRGTGAELYLKELEKSSTFACPDSIAAMLKAYDLPADIFQGSVVRCDHGAEKEETLQKARSRLKTDIQIAWSQEAVEKGVAHAKDGEFSAACECYKQALDIYPQNADAMVAMGAAHANQENFQKALDYFSKALDLRPDHANALKYKEAVNQRMAPAPQPASRSRSGEPAVSGAMDAKPEHSTGDRTGGAAEQNSGPPKLTAAVPSGTSAMNTQEALRIVSNHYERHTSSDTDSSREKKSKRHREKKKKKKKKAHKHQKTRRRV